MQRARHVARLMHQCWICRAHVSTFPRGLFFCPWNRFDVGWPSGTRPPSKRASESDFDSYDASTPELPRQPLPPAVRRAGALGELDYQQGTTDCIYAAPFGIGPAVLLSAVVWDTGRDQMRPALVLLCVGGLMACDSSTSTNPTNTAISSALKPGMTEQQVAQVSNTRVPNRVVMQTCGSETPAPFACKAYIYDRGFHAGAKLTVVFESVRGQWVVSQWF